MMKRFELSRFSPLEVSRRVQQCLRFEGVNTNGVAATNGIGVESEDPPVLGGGPPCCGDGTHKTNLLTTIKKKLKKSKRNNKRCDGVRTTRLDCGAPCQCENCELHACCPPSKHHRTRKHNKQGAGDKCSVWPAVLRSQNHQQPESKTDDVAELIPSSAAADDPELPPCACFGGQRDYAGGLSSCGGASPGLEPPGRDDPLPPEDATMQVALFGGAHQADAAEPPRVGNLTQELYRLSKYGWYWGPINRGEAEEKLADQPDGAFLVRDSSDDRYILSLSFRSYGKTLHTRIEHSNGLFSFYAQPEPEGHASIVELIQQSMCYSQSGVFCYSRGRSPGSPSFPVRLTKPISRFTQVRSLQYLCRFVIRQFTRYDHIQKLPLPPRIKGYLEEGHY